MRTIVIFYSLEGNTEFVAKKIKEQMNADIMNIAPVDAYPTGRFSKFIFGGKSVFSKEETKIKEHNDIKGKYDLVILGSPVWASNITPPMRTFLNEGILENAKIALFLNSAGGGDKKAFPKFKEALIEGNKGIKEEDIIANLHLVDPKKKPKAEDEAKIKEFCDKLKNFK